MHGNRDETNPYFPNVEPTDEPTLRLPPSMTPAGGDAGAAEGRAQVALVAGTGPQLSTVTSSLRLRRLRAAALFLIAMQGLLLTWRVAIGGGGLWQLNVAIILGLGAAAAFLQGKGPFSERRIKGVEAALFGLMVVYLAVRQYQLIVDDQVSPTELLAVGRGSMILAILLMFVYTKFVPNDWKGTARVVIPIALVPASTTIVAALIHPEVFRRVHESASLSSISENVLFMSVASILAIYGAHVQNTLRTEAFEARQLNQYRLVRRLGSGGMGEVFLAEHHMMKRRAR